MLPHKNLILYSRDVHLCWWGYVEYTHKGCTHTCTYKSAHKYTLRHPTHAYMYMQAGRQTHTHTHPHAHTATPTHAHTHTNTSNHTIT